MRTYQVALLSFGRSGKVFHAPFIQVHPGFRLAGAWERSKKSIQSAYAGTKSYESLESLLQDPEVDLVIVNTPNATHFEYARQALMAGKHVLVEKAFTTTVAEAEELIQLANERELKLSVYQNRRWDSDFQTTRQVIESGELGQLVEVTFAYERYNPGLSAKAHKEIAGPGSGIVKDLGPHLIDQALLLFGMPTEVFADIRITRPVSRVDDYFEILLYYDTLRVRLKSGCFVREPGPGYLVHGMKGSFYKSRADVQESSLLAGLLPDAPDWGEEPAQQQGLLHIGMGEEERKSNVSSLRGNYMAFYDALYESLAHNMPLPVTAEEGVNVIKIIELAFKSSEQKQVVKVS